MSAPEVTLTSPFASRHWLASEIATLMRQAPCTASDLARQARVDPRKISYLLKAERKASVADVAKILEHLQVPTLRRRFILQVAEAAEQNGWWERYSIEMGSRQATYADLETGAEIVEFSQTLIPGLLQTEAYAMGRAVADRLYYSKRFLVDRAVEGRKLRKQVLSGAHARGYQAVIDEAVLRRAVATPAVIQDQINHLVSVAMQTPAVTIRILRLGTPLPEDAIPATSFSIYRYPDLEKMQMVAVEIDDTDLFITEPVRTATYRGRYEALRSVAMPPPDTLDFLEAEAENLSRSAWRSA